MTFEELVAEVITITNRPDMGLPSAGGDGNIPSAVVAATQTLHNKDFFFRDIATADIDLAQEAYIHEWDISGLPFYKSLSYIRKWDPSVNSYALDPTVLPPMWLTGIDGVQFNTAQATAFLALISPTAIFDSYQQLKVDVAYQAGYIVHIRSSTPLRWLKVGWYVFPNVNWKTSQFRSWIADLFPWAIIYHAASRIFTDIGEQEKSRKYDNPNGGLLAEQLELLMKSNVTPVGY